MYGGLLIRGKRLSFFWPAILLATAITGLLTACGTAPAKPQDPAPQSPDQQQDQPPAAAPEPAGASTTASYDRSSRKLSIDVRSEQLRPATVVLSLPAGISSLGGTSFRFPAGSGTTETELVFSELGAYSSELGLSCSQEGTDKVKQLLLNIPHPRLELSADYDPATHVLMVGAVHPYGEPVNLRLSPSLGLDIDGPLDYSFSSGVGTRAFKVEFSNPQINSGAVALDFSAPRCVPIHLASDVSRARIISDKRWLLPENILRVSLDNGYSGGAGLPLSLECITPPGISVVGEGRQDLPGASGTLEFKLAFDSTEASDFAVRLRASDPEGHSDEQSIDVCMLPPPLPLGSLVVYPLANHVKAGQPLRFIAASGRTAEPLLFMAGVALTFPPSASYVQNSFNIGAPGGPLDQSDGIWSACKPAGGYITLVDESYASAGTLLGGRKMLTFNITPLAGQELADAQGALFSFELRFSQRGSFSVDVLDYPLLGVPQTYYFNLRRPQVFWHDVSGLHPGVPREVTVE